MAMATQQIPWNCNDPSLGMRWNFFESTNELLGTSSESENHC